MQDNYEVKGLELIAHDVPTEPSLKGCESITYQTSSGSKLSVVKDSMGVQICRQGVFYPGYFKCYDSVAAAVNDLRENTQQAIDFFDQLVRQIRISNAKKN